MEGNFRKCENCKTHDTAFDTTSLMHYHRLAFTANGKPTITKKGCASCQLGQYNGLSSSDATEINRLYCGGANPDENVCDDESTYAQYCKDWANYGFCQVYELFMKRNCKKSCKVCRGK